MILLTKNLLEVGTSTVTVSPAALAAKPITRIYDRERSLEYEGGSIAQADIDVDLGGATSVTAWAVLNNNVTGVTVTLFGDASSPPTTSRDSVAVVGGAEWLRTFAPLSFRFWRVRVPVMASAPRIGEVFLGSHYDIANPEVQSTEAQQGNVTRDESPGGYVWKVLRGAQRYRLSYKWTSMSDADWASLKAAHAETSQSAKAFPIIDTDGVVRWVEFVQEALRRTRIFNNVNGVDAEFLEVL